MPRIPKPYPYKGWFRTNAGGKRGHRLCRIDEGKTKARRVLNLYLATLAERKSVGSGVQAAGRGETRLTGELHDEFLDFKKTESEPLTYRHYVDKLKPFVERFGHLALNCLTENDGLAYKRWLLAEKEWLKGSKKPGRKSLKVKGVGPTSCNHFLRAAKTFLNWACHSKRRYLPNNPWADIKLLQEKPRERLITDEEFRHLTDQAGDADFRELLFFMRYTTARPGEVRALEWDMIDWDNHRIMIDRRRVKTRRVRSLTLLPEVEDRLRARQVRMGGLGNVFRNADGRAWTAVSFSQKFRRLRNRCARLGLVQEEKNGEKLVLYSTRHTRNVEMIRDDGIDLSIASKKMGHANITTTVRHYLHLTDSDVTNAVRRSRMAAAV